MSFLLLKFFNLIYAFQLNLGNVSVVLRSPPYLQHREPMIETTNRMPENPMAILVHHWC